MPKQLVIALDRDSADEEETAALIALMQQEHFDLRRKMFLSIVVDFAQRRDRAYRASESFADGGWDRTLYGDSSGWVVRLTRTRRITRDALLEGIAEVKQRAAQHGGHVRGLTVEDLRTEDRWGEMASQLRDRALRQADTDTATTRLVPAQREAAVGEGTAVPLSP